MDGQGRGGKNGDITKLLFILQNLIVKVQSQQLYQIQKTINDFIWNRKKSRVKIDTPARNHKRGLSSTKYKAILLCCTSGSVVDPRQ